MTDKEDIDDTYEDKETIRETIAREVEEYVARGGEIQQIDTGVRTDTLDGYTRFNNDSMY